jgi:MFS family permease
MKLLIDLTPLRRSRDLRRLVAGQLLSTVGAQFTAVAVPYQVYVLTRSSLDVGLVSLAQVIPLIGGALLGGSLADALDRRKLVLVSQSLTALCSAGLAINAVLGPALWPLFSCPPWQRAACRPPSRGSPRSCRIWSVVLKWLVLTPCFRRFSS